jgi:hypothetical protein
MAEKLKALFLDKKFYFPKKELPDEKIGNQKVYHYLVAINKEINSRNFLGFQKKALYPEKYPALQNFGQKGNRF